MKTVWNPVSVLCFLAVARATAMEIPSPRLKGVELEHGITPPSYLPMVGAQDRTPRRSMPTKTETKGGCDDQMRERCQLKRELDPFGTCAAYMRYVIIKCQTAPSKEECEACWEGGDSREPAWPQRDPTTASFFEACDPPGTNPVVTVTAKPSPRPTTLSGTSSQDKIFSDLMKYLDVPT